MTAFIQRRWRRGHPHGSNSAHHTENLRLGRWDRPVVCGVVLDHRMGYPLFLLSYHRLLLPGMRHFPYVFGLVPSAVCRSLPPQSGGADPLFLVESDRPWLLFPKTPFYPKTRFFAGVALCNHRNIDGIWAIAQYFAVISSTKFEKRLHNSFGLWYTDNTNYMGGCRLCSVNIAALIALITHKSARLAVRT